MENVWPCDVARDVTRQLLLVMIGQYFIQQKGPNWKTRTVALLLYKSWLVQSQQALELSVPDKGVYN